jgi:hypothetical protein
MSSVYRLARKSLCLAGLRLLGNAAENVEPRLQGRLGVSYDQQAVGDVPCVVSRWRPAFPSSTIRASSLCLHDLLLGRVEAYGWFSDGGYPVRPGGRHVGGSATPTVSAADSSGERLVDSAGTTDATPPRKY